MKRKCNRFVLIGVKSESSDRWSQAIFREGKKGSWIGLEVGNKIQVEYTLIGDSGESFGFSPIGFILYISNDELLLGPESTTPTFSDACIRIKIETIKHIHRLKIVESL